MVLSIGAIDDDDAILYTLKAMASVQGWDMLTTSDPYTCFQWVSNGEVEILLVDYHMPQMNGQEIIERSREISKDIVLIALTVEEKEDVASSLLLAGADDFITKPIHLADFQSRIRLHEKLVRHRRNLNWDERQKGISRETVRKVVEYLRKKGLSVSCTELSRDCELSYVSSHRYLEYLSNRGRVLKTMDNPDGKPGRPSYRYKWKEPDRG